MHAESTYRKVPWDRISGAGQAGRRPRADTGIFKPRKINKLLIFLY